MSTPKYLNAPFRLAQSEIQQYVLGLEGENLKLNKHIGSFRRGMYSNGVQRVNLIH
jgi:exonuclease VII small subunit